MSQSFVSRIGGIVSADIAVPEHERVLRFYSRVLTTGDNPLWREDLMSNIGVPVIGVGARTPEHSNLPVQWMPHIQVDDVATSVARGRDLGGTELMHGKDDSGNSQWAVLLDPNGAAFGLVGLLEEVPRDALPQQAPDDAGPVGRIPWLELTVKEASASGDFYRQVVGWTIEEVEMTDADERYADYNMLGGDGNPAAGVCHARGVNLGVPPVWMIYLPVGDVTESIRRVSEEGGKIVKAPLGSNGVHSYAVVQDPVGGCVTLCSG